MTEKSWFVLRYNHFPPPPDGPIKLGQLIPLPTEPHQPIDFSGPTPFPPYMPVIPSREENFAWETSSNADGHAALSAQMDGLPVSGTIQAEFKKSTRNWADFEALETDLIVPTPGYVRESMARPAVKEFLGKHLLPKSVFMITGLKVARRAKLGREKTSGGGGLVKLGVDPTLGVNLGPDVGGNVEKKEKVESKATDFVWAFSLRQVHYRRGVAGKSNTYKDGATLEDNSGDNYEEEEKEVEAVDPSKLEVVLDGLADEDFTGATSKLVNVAEVHTDEKDRIILVSDKI